MKRKWLNQCKDFGIFTLQPNLRKTPRGGKIMAKIMSMKVESDIVDSVVFGQKRDELQIFGQNSNTSTNTAGKRMERLFLRR